MHTESDTLWLLCRCNETFVYHIYISCESDKIWMSEWIIGRTLIVMYCVIERFAPMWWLKARAIIRFAYQRCSVKTIERKKNSNQLNRVENKKKMPLHLRYADKSERSNKSYNFIFFFFGAARRSIRKCVRPGTHIMRNTVQIDTFGTVRSMSNDTQTHVWLRYCNYFLFFFFVFRKIKYIE